jgi:hypothetical protein
VAAALLLALLLSCVAPEMVPAQVFIASQPNPPFRIGPLFVSATVARKAIVGQNPGPLTVTVAWSVVVPRGRTAADIGQDLYLLWPGEVAATEGAGEGDPTLVREVESLGFKVKRSGRLRLSARARSEMGTRAEARALEEAPFVTFGRDITAADARGATYVRIPWRAEFASLDWLARLDLPLKAAIEPRRVTWIEDTFWGRRYTVALGFGDVGYVSLYPLYFGARDRLVPLARDFSMVFLNFDDAAHLKIDTVAPSAAGRRMSETRANTETILLPLVASEGLAPQVLKVQFSYFAGRMPWRPILISALFLVLGNLTGPLFSALAHRASRTFRSRVHVGRGDESERRRGAVPSRDALEKIRPGETSYDEVLRLCGPHAEEQERLPGQTRTLLYRGERVVPSRGRSFGWVATVNHWDVEHHEVQIDFERDRVRDVQLRVRRARLGEPEA